MVERRVGGERGRKSRNSVLQRKESIHCTVVLGCQLNMLRVQYDVILGMNTMQYIFVDGVYTSEGEEGREVFSLPNLTGGVGGCLSRLTCLTCPPWRRR